MRRCRRRTFLLVLVVCGVSICLCFHSVSLLSREQGDSLPSRMFVQHRIEPREVVMNGQREILNVDHQPPVMVATVSSSGKAKGPLALRGCKRMSHRIYFFGGIQEVV